jgi:peptide/nickel transport system substrate-binding protein
MKGRNTTMKNKYLVLAVVVVLILATLLGSCTSKTTSSTTSSTTVTKPTQSTTTPTTTTSNVTTSVNWWDKFGAPKYGGTITLGVGGLTGTNFDIYTFVGADFNFWLEPMFRSDWSLDRNTWPFTAMFVPDAYIKGNLAESWEFTDTTTITVHLRQGVKFQNKAPVNGRDLTAYDVQSHYNRLLGTGDGYTAIAPMYNGQTGTLAKVSASDKYTVVYSFKSASLQNIYTIADRLPLNQVEAPEWVALGTAGSSGTTTTGTNSLQDWTTVVGTGPWMLTNFTSGSSFNYVKNPDYWGTDLRYPQNKVPYADKLDVLIIPDTATRVAALRTGKIDTLTGNTFLTYQQATELTKNSSSIVQSTQPAGAQGIGFRIDKEPFTNVKIRQAFDMAIDRKGIASSIYGGATTGNPVGLFTTAYKGYAYSYAEWSQSLKDEYAYNPTAAKQLLADAGYPNGFKTNVVTSTDAAGLELLQAIKANLSDIGVEMEIKSMDSATLQAFTRGGKHDQLMSRPSAYTFPPSRLVNLYYSKSNDAAFSGVNDATFDALHDKFLAATDSATAAAACQEMDKYFIGQHWEVNVGESYNYIAWQSSLKGYSGESEAWGQMIDWACMWKAQ